MNQPNPPRSFPANPSDIQSNPRAIQAKTRCRLSLLVALIRLACLLLTCSSTSVRILLSVCIITPGLQSKVCILHWPHWKICFFAKTPLWENTSKLHHPSSPNNKLHVSLVPSKYCMSSVLHTFKEVYSSLHCSKILPFSYICVPDKVHSVADPAT